MKMTMHFVRLRRMLRSEEITPEAKRYRVYMEVEQILQELPQQPADDQRDIRAALYQLGLLPDRRAGGDRREQAVASGFIIPPEVLERRSGKERREERDLGQWLLAED